MNIQEKKSHLMSLGVHDLRNIARMWGVPTPTTKLKDELIEYILRAFSGDTSFVKQSHAGRPAKITAESRNYEKELYPEKFEEFYKNRQVCPILDQRCFEFNQDVVINPIGDLIIVKGYVLEHELFCYFVDEELDDIIFIPNILFYEKNLEVGDYIKARAISGDGRHYAVKEIIEINNSKSERSLICFKDIAQSKNKVFGIDEGGKKYVQMTDNFKFFDDTKQLVQVAKNGNYIVSFLSVKMEAASVLLARKKLNATEFISYTENSPLYSFEIINNAINNSIVRARSGEKILLFVNDIEKIIAELNTYFELQGEIKSNKNCTGTISLIRKLLGINRVLTNGGSVTLVVLTSSKTFSEKDII